MVSSIALLVLGGGFIGLLSGLLGVGGAVVIVPLLHYYFVRQGIGGAMIQQLALGTSLATILFTTFSSFWGHRRYGSMRMDLWKLMTPGLIIGTFGGALLAPHLPQGFLRGLFSCVIFYLSIRILQSDREIQARAFSRRFLAASGLAVGLISSLVGVAGTMLCVTVLVWAAVEWREAVGTASGLSLPICVTGTVGYVVSGWGRPDLPAYTLGFVYLPGMMSLLVSSVVMAYLGARISHCAWLPVQPLRTVFALGVMILAGYQLTQLLLY